MKKRFMKKIICFMLVFIICIVYKLNWQTNLLVMNQLPAFAAENKTIIHSEVVLSEIESNIDSYVNEHLDTTAAMSVTVFTRDEILMEKAYGYTDMEAGIVNDNETVFEWGSCTKLITWVSVMQLSEKGLIDLNEDIRTYLPANFFKKLKYDTPITMLNLMNHNAGWQEVASDIFIKDIHDIKDLGDALRYIEPDQVNRPGEIVAYSNWSSALAGYIVERVSGQSFSDYVHANIFEPLGMEHTAISPDLSDNSWVSEKRRKEKCYTTDNISLGTCHYYISLYPAGMATGTMSDFVKFAKAFLPKKGDTSPLFDNAATLDEMLSPSLYYADNMTARNCHGFWTDQLGVPVLWHDGGTVGSTSWFAFDKESGTGIVTLTNQSGESIYTCGLLPLVFGKFNNPQIEENSTDISGVYANSRSCFKGYTKLFSLFSIMELSKNDDGSYTVPGADITLTGINKNSYLMDMGGLKQFVIFTTTDHKGRTILQMIGSDNIKANGFDLLVKYLLLLLFVIAVVYSLIALIVKAVRLIQHKHKPMDTIRSITNISALVCFSLFIYIASNLLFTNAPMYQNVQWSLILCVIIAVFPVINAILLVIKWRQITCKKRVRAGLIINCIIGLIVSFNVFYWII